MTPKQEAALRQALDCVSTLANARDWVGCTPNERWDEDEMYAELCNATICLKKSLSIIQEALAKQPAQQEPVAMMTVLHLKDRTEIGYGPALAGYNLPTGEYKLYTSPPASKPWVGLTLGEAVEIWTKTKQLDTVIKLVEAKLKEKNA